MADQLIHYEAEDGVGVITLDDPPANTYTYEMMRQLDESILEARFDEEGIEIPFPQRDLSGTVEFTGELPG